MAGGDETSELWGWEISVLFLLFAGISIAWQIFIAVVTFINSFYGGAKTIWLTRLKEEVLDVGVISLVLVFLDPYISNICVTSSSSGSSYPAYGSSYPPPATSSASPLPDTQTAAGRRRLLNEVLSHLGRQLLAGGSPEPCPEGKRHLFPKGSIATAHYLLFFVALVHILYSLLTFTLTLHRFSRWSSWEKRARLEEQDAADVLENDGRSSRKRGLAGACSRMWAWACCCCRPAPRTSLHGSPRGGQAPPRGCCAHWLCTIWRYVQGGIDSERYMVMRGLFQLRARHHRARAFVDNLHYTNVCENAMEIDIANVVAHGYLQALIVAVFMLYTTEVYQILWIGGLSMVTQAILVAKMESVVARVMAIVRVAGSQYHIDTAAEEYLRISSCSSWDEEYEVRYSSSSGSSGSEEEDLERPFTPREPRGHSQTHPHRHRRPPSLTSQAHLQHGHHADSRGQPPASLKHIRLSSDFAASGDRAGKFAGASTAAAGVAGANGYASAGHAYGNGYGNGPVGQSPFTQAAAQGHGYRGGPVGEAAEGSWWQQAACVRSGRRRGHGGHGVRRGARRALLGPGPHAVAEAGEGGAAGHRVDAAALVWWGSGGDEARLNDGSGSGGMLERGDLRYRAIREDMDSLWWQTASDADTQLDSGSGDVGALQRAQGGTRPRRPFPMSLAEHLRRSSRRFSGHRARKGLGLFSQPGSARTGAGAAVSGGGTGTRSAGPVSEAQQGSRPSGSDGEDGQHDGRSPATLEAFMSGGRRNPLYDLEHLDADMPHLTALADEADPARLQQQAAALVALGPPGAALRGDTGGSGAGASRAGSSMMGSRAGSGVGRTPLGGLQSFQRAGSKAGSPGAAAGAGVSPGGSAKARLNDQLFANPLFREGSVVSNSFTNAARAAAVTAAAVAATDRTAAPQGLQDRVNPAAAVAAAMPVSAATAAHAQHKQQQQQQQLHQFYHYAGAAQEQRQQQADAAAQQLAAMQASLPPLRSIPSLGWRPPRVSGNGTTSNSGSAKELIKKSSSKRLLGLMGFASKDPSRANSGGHPGVTVGGGGSGRTSASGTATAAAAAGNGTMYKTASGKLRMKAPDKSILDRGMSGRVSESGVLLSEGEAGREVAAAPTRLYAGVESGTGSGNDTPAAPNAGTPAAAAAAAGAAALAASTGYGTAPRPPPITIPYDPTSPPPSSHAALAAPIEPTASLPPKDSNATQPRAGTAAMPLLHEGMEQHAAPRPLAPPGLGAVGHGANPSGHASRLGLPRTGSMGSMSAAPATVDMGLVERKLRSLFWLRKPQLLIWLSHLNFLQNSLSITLCIYYLIEADASILKLESRLLYVWLPLLAANMVFMVYMGWVVVPLYTLVSTTTTRNPRVLHHHIQRHKKAEQEEEGGITGFCVELLMRCFKRQHHHAVKAHAKHGAGDASGLNTAFMTNLANQAGVIMASDAQLSKKMGPAEAIYREYMQIWRSKARVAQGLEPPQPEGYTLQADVSDFRTAFMSLDADGSSQVTTEELFTHLHVLGTRATKTELKSMIQQIDHDGDKKVDFDEFVVFMVFCFFDGNGNSCVEIPDIRKVFRRLHLRSTEAEVEAMMDLADPDGDRKIGLRQFFKLFQDVTIPALGPRPANFGTHVHPAPSGASLIGVGRSGPSGSHRSPHSASLSRSFVSTLVPAGATPSGHSRQHGHGAQAQAPTVAPSGPSLSKSVHGPGAKSRLSRVAGVDAEQQGQAQGRGRAAAGQQQQQGVEQGNDLAVVAHSGMWGKAGAAAVAAASGELSPVASGSGSGHASRG